MQNERGRVRRAASLLRCVRDWLQGVDWFGADVEGVEAARCWGLVDRLRLAGGLVFPFWCGLLLVRSGDGCCGWGVSLSVGVGCCDAEHAYALPSLPKARE